MIFFIEAEYVQCLFDMVVNTYIFCCIYTRTTNPDYVQCYLPGPMLQTAPVLDFEGGIGDFTFSLLPTPGVMA